MLLEAPPLPSVGRGEVTTYALKKSLHLIRRYGFLNKLPMNKVEFVELGIVHLIVTSIINEIQLDLLRKCADADKVGHDLRKAQGVICRGV